MKRLRTIFTDQGSWSPSQRFCEQLILALTVGTSCHFSTDVPKVVALAAIHTAQRCITTQKDWPHTSHRQCSILTFAICTVTDYWSMQLRHGWGWLSDHSFFEDTIDILMDGNTKVCEQIWEKWQLHTKRQILALQAIIISRQWGPLTLFLVYGHIRPSASWMFESVDSLLSEVVSVKLEV